MLCVLPLQIEMLSTAGMQTVYCWCSALMQQHTAPPSPTAATASPARASVPPKMFSLVDYTPSVSCRPIAGTDPLIGTSSLQCCLFYILSVLCKRRMCTLYGLSATLARLNVNDAELITLGYELKVIRSLPQLAIGSGVRLLLYGSIAARLQSTA